MNSCDLELSIKDRLLFSNFLPQQGGFLEMTIAIDIKDKVNITQEEAKELNIKSEGNSTTWGKEKNCVFCFTEAEKQLIKSELKKKDNAKQITVDLYDLAFKITNW